MAQKTFSSEFKAKVAISAIKGERTINELSSEFGVHYTLIHRWKKEILEGCKDLFNNKREKEKEDFETEREKLHAQIGQLLVELEWLKKKTGHFG